MKQARNVLLGIGAVVIAVIAYNVVGTSGPVSQLVPAPAPFGFAEPCDRPSPRSPASEENATRVFAMTSSVTGPWRTLYSDGGLGVSADTLGDPPQIAIAGNTPLRYQLSPAGVNLITGRVVGAGITPGCRRLKTTRLSGELLMWTDKGYYDMAWGPDITMPTLRLSPDAETALGELDATLTLSPISLPADAWTAGGTHPSLLSNYHWLFLVHVAPSVGQVVDGQQLGGNDLYRRLLMPGGVAPEKFGQVMAVPGQDGPGSTLRCGVASPEDGARLAAAFFDDPGGAEYAITPDLSSIVKVVVEPIFLANYGCDDLAADLAPAPVSGVAMPAVTGLLAGIDACGFVSDEAQADLGADGHVERVALHPFGVPANSCALTDSKTGFELASVSLYPDRAVGDVLEQALRSAFGQRPPTESIGAQSVFHQDNVFAVDNGEEMVAIEFNSSADIKAGPLASSPVSAERAFVSAVAAHVH